MLQLLKPMGLEPVLRNKRSHCNEKPVHLNEAREQQPRPNAAKNKIKKRKKERNLTKYVP